MNLVGYKAYTTHSPSMMPLDVREFVSNKLSQIRHAAVGATEAPQPAPTVVNVLGTTIGQIAGGAAGGYALSKFVFKKSNFWSTVVGAGGGGVGAFLLGGDPSGGWLWSILAAYGASRYVHDKGA